MKVYLATCQKTAEVVVGRAPYDKLPNTYMCFVSMLHYCTQITCFFKCYCFGLYSIRMDFFQYILLNDPWPVAGINYPSYVASFIMRHLLLFKF